MRAGISKSSLNKNVTLAFPLLSHCWFYRGVTEQLQEGPCLLQPLVHSVACKLPPAFTHQSACNTFVTIITTRHFYSSHALGMPTAGKGTRAGRCTSPWAAQGCAETQARVLKPAWRGQQSPLLQL